MSEPNDRLRNVLSIGHGISRNMPWLMQHFLFKMILKRLRLARPARTISRKIQIHGLAKIGKHASCLGNKACASFVPPCHELILCRHYFAATTRPWFVQTLELWQLFGALATKAAHSFIELPENYQTIDSKTKTHNKGIESGPHCGTAGQGQAGWDADRKMRQEKQAYLVPS